MMLDATKYELTIRLIFCNKPRGVCSFFAVVSLFDLVKMLGPDTQMYTSLPAEIIPMELLFEHLKVLLMSSVVEMVLAMQVLYEDGDPVYHVLRRHVGHVILDQSANVL